MDWPKPPKPVAPTPAAFWPKAPPVLLGLEKLPALDPNAPPVVPKPADAVDVLPNMPCVW